MTTKKRMIEKQVATTDANKLPFGLPLKPVDIAPPLTFVCQRCGAACQWAEPHGFDCQVATTEQRRKRVIGDGSEAGKK